jgi:hypothetical protein
MRRCVYLAISLAALLLVVSPQASAQDDSVSLGDLARSIRKAKEEPKKEPAPPVVIDNDNLSQVMDAVENHKLNALPVLSLDSRENQFRMSSPDGTCSLSFNADAASLITPPYVAEELPQGELAKLEGPAKIDGDRLQITLFNGTDWSLKEVTIGLTIVRKSATADLYQNARLLPALAQDAPVQEIPAPADEKQSDLTLLLHLKGAAAPLATTIYRETLGATLASDQEWHWAIVSAKGVPPSPASLPSFGMEPAASVPASGEIQDQMPVSAPGQNHDQ